MQVASQLNVLAQTGMDKIGDKNLFVFRMHLPSLTLEILIWRLSRLYIENIFIGDAIGIVTIDHNSIPYEIFLYQ